MISAESVQRFTFLDQADSKWRVACACLCVILFALAMGLIGTTKLYGIFYASSIAASLPLLVSWRKPAASTPARTYAIVYSLIFALYCLHVFLLRRDLGNLDNISRVGLGFINGAFFLAFFRHERQSLFSFLVLLAIVHSTVAVAVSIWQGVHFSTFALSGVRTGGVTNPIPFSQMLMASLGIVAIYWSGKLNDGNVVRGGIAMLIFLSFGVFALVLTGTRGTMLAIVPLAVLAFANARMRSGWSRGAILLLPLIVVLGLAIAIGGRNLPCLECLAQLPEKGLTLGQAAEWVGPRLQIWLAVLELAQDQWLFGHGLGAYPAVLTKLGIPANSILYSFNEVHNQYLSFMIDTGIVGFSLFIALLGTAVFAGIGMLARVESRERGLVLLWVAGCYAIFGLSESFFSRAVTSLQFGVYMGFLMWTIPTRQERLTQHRSPDRAAV